MTLSSHPWGRVNFTRRARAAGGVPAPSVAAALRGWAAEEEAECGRAYEGFMAADLLTVLLCAPPFGDAFVEGSHS